MVPSVLPLNPQVTTLNLARLAVISSLACFVVPIAERGGSSLIPPSLRTRGCTSARLQHCHSVLPYGRWVTAMTAIEPQRVDSSTPCCPTVKVFLPTPDCAGAPTKRWGPASLGNGSEETELKCKRRRLYVKCFQDMDLMALAWRKVCTCWARAVGWA